MRKLLILRGLPGAGKSTFITNMGFEPYTISPDALRELYAGYSINAKGQWAISQACDKVVWERVYEILEYKMVRGSFTVVDATNISQKTLNKYAELINKYAYEGYIIDFTNVSEEECLKRNQDRGVKKVPDEVIYRMAEKLKTADIPSCFSIIQPEDVDEKILTVKPINVDQYENIVVVGDIHGCLNELKRLEIKENCLYVFLGDYIDRGPESAETLKYLNEIYERGNVILLRGNHEDNSFRKWFQRNVEKMSRVFVEKTIHNFLQNDLDENFAKDFFKKLKDYYYFEFDKKEYLCTHGFISSECFSELIDAYQVIHGSGNYNEYLTCVETWRNNDKIQIAGHRNIDKLDIKVSDNVYNLEGAVEFGGELRYVIIEKDGIKCERIKSDYNMLKN